MHIGESFVGSGPNAAHINVLIGPRSGPVGQSLANSLAAPRLGYIPFMACLQPNVPVKPATLFVAKADLRGETHETMTWGPAQAGVAKGVQDCLLDGSLPPEAENDWAVVAAVWVNWSADNASQVFANNLQATREAIQRAMANLPTLQQAAAASARPANPFFDSAA
ncbi:MULTISPECIES: formaldehyde-activating enzyme [Aquitalea]|jgi:5,6,7,8-tetrahydromethanopterin hydro-lyase|uniref:5,6,7,8-tetrahydromethanopterin hydro-lyase n=1 Tax=Aquitalea magnusonii TaxID=332411 RepID=A0A318JJS2_9NEIS|nr:MULTISPECIES: formaldehyde-activating enzyme [Aquitalea]PXX50627.1 5,6,7,8-tetrahydromethanopterin hydro-lyase [Aquitalea magnusonii]